METIKKNKTKRQHSEMEKIFANKATEKELIPKYTSSACSTLPEKKNQPTNQTNKKNPTKQAKRKKNKNKHPS